MQYTNVKSPDLRKKSGDAGEWRPVCYSLALRTFTEWLDPTPP